MYKEMILKFLQERSPNKYTSGQIVYYMTSQGLSESVVYSNLKKMRKEVEVLWEWSEQLNQNGRPCRVYYLKVKK